MRNNNKLPDYYVGYSQEVEAIVAVRADAQNRVSEDLREIFGGRVEMTFNIFASIQFSERHGNDFGRAFFVNHNGQPTQIVAGSTDHEHTYALLSIVCAKAVDEFMSRGQTYWSRVMAWRLSENQDVANLWQAITTPKAVVAA